MGRFVLRRLLQAVPTLVGITVVSFGLIRLAPGDPITLLGFGSSDLTAQDLAAVRRAYGLDQPLPIQYLSWLGHLLGGDFGQSLLYHRPVRQMIASALPNTLLLASLAVCVSLLVGIPLGVLAARYRGTLVDEAIRILAVAGHAVPNFWLGLLFILVFGVDLRLFPVGGMLTVGASDTDLADRVRHLVGPVFALSLAGIANYSRYMRTETLEALGQDFVRTARAKGLRERQVVSVHALRNALLPLITALGSLVVSFVSGALVIEQVFAWPGMGRMTFEAARAKDYPIIMGVVVISGAVVLVAFILRDLAYAVADPRIRIGRG